MKPEELFSCMSSQDPSHNMNSWEKELKKAREEERESVFNELIFDKKTDSLKINPEAVEKVSAHVREETANKIFEEQNEILDKLVIELELIVKHKRNNLVDCVHQYQKICGTFNQYLKMLQKHKKKFLKKEVLE